MVVPSFRAPKEPGARDSHSSSARPANGGVAAGGAWSPSMISQPLISVVTPAYNEENCILNWDVRSMRST
jgi:hypothetical protein